MKDYKVSVPVNCINFERFNKKELLESLKSLDAERVFLNFEESVDSGGVYFREKNKHDEQMKCLKNAVTFFKQEGFEVAAWFWTFMVDKDLDFTSICDFDGNEVSGFACPTDERFIEYAAKTIKDIASCGVDMIAFNDDFRYGFFSGDMTCLCETHRKLICDKVGENLSREQLKQKIKFGGKNKYRDAFLEVNKESFLTFASRMRKVVDSVNPMIRMGFCAAMTAWDIDGDAYELALALAGNTRPFVRLIGAPYWAQGKSWGNRLQDVIELNRMEKSYFEGRDIELIAEGDVWPRPRTACPATFLEEYDKAMRATQTLDGILKIAIDYAANIDYESGYVKFHERNKQIYHKIEEAFDGKTCVGIRVYEYAKKISDMVNPNELSEMYKPEKLFFSEAARTMTCNGIPTVYEGEGCGGIVFGENARKLPLEALAKGLIVDTAAAKILSDRGIDVGVTSFGERVSITNEIVCKDGNKIIAPNSASYKVTLNPEAKVLSVGSTEHEKIPMSFTHTNASGQRFLVINTNPRENEVLMRHYVRGYQYCEFISDEFYAVCPGHPDLYLLCSEGDGSLAVGVWNFCIDPVVNPIVYLGKKYSDIHFINGEGVLQEANIVQLNEIPGYGFTGFVLS